MATSTFYPDANPESTSCDGQSGYENGSESWAVMRAKTDGNFADANSVSVIVAVKNSGAGDDGLGRGFLLFDTSSIPDGDTITSASLWLKPSNVESDPNGSYALAVVQSSPASDTDIMTADFDQCGSLNSPDEGATRVAHADFSLDTYKEIPLNATGLSWISKTGITKLGIREGYYDIDGNDPTSGRSAIRFHSADNTSGISNAPKLVVEHSAGGATTPTPTLALLGVG